MGELRGAGRAEDQAHLLRHSASQVLQHVQHLEDVKRTHHLDPLESSCLKGQEREGRALEKRSRGSHERKRDSVVEREEALKTQGLRQGWRWALSDGPVLSMLAAWVLSCKAKSELRGKEGQ